MAIATLKIILRSQESALRKSIANTEDVRNWFVDNDYDDKFGFSSIINDVDDAIKLLEKAKRFISEHVDCMDRKDPVCSIDIEDAIEWSEQISRDCEEAEVIAKQAEAAARQHINNNPEPTPQVYQYRDVTEADISQIVEATNHPPEAFRRHWTKGKLLSTSRDSYPYIVCKIIAGKEQPYDYFKYARIKVKNDQI